MVMLVVLTFVIGVVAGLRALLPLAMVSWAMKLGDAPLSRTPLAWMGGNIAPWIFAVLAIGELITDKLPTTASRKVPPQFIARVVSGALAGATIGYSKEAYQGVNAPWIGLAAGAVGAIVGTLGGSAVRVKVGEMFGKDLPAALMEDAVAILMGIAVVTQL
jgi:uncharacterized membrane protein